MSVNTITNFPLDDVISELAISRTRNGDRIHRAGCRRQGSSTSLATILEQQPSRIAAAEAASCCKPRYMDEIGEHAASLSEGGEGYVDEEPVETAHMEIIAEEPAEEQEPTDEVAALTIPFNTSKVAKHYWKPFARQASVRLAETLDMRVTTTANDATFRGTAEQVADAESYLRWLWTEGYAAFNTWRKTDEAYKAIKTADAGAHWFKSERADAEIDWLEGFVLSTLQGEVAR